VRKGRGRFDPRLFEHVINGRSPQRGDGFASWRENDQLSTRVRGAKRGEIDVAVTDREAAARLWRCPRWAADGHYSPKDIIKGGIRERFAELRPMASAP